MGAPPEIATLRNDRRSRMEEGQRLAVRREERDTADGTLDWLGHRTIQTAKKYVRRIDPVDSLDNVVHDLSSVGRERDHLRIARIHLLVCLEREAEFCHADGRSSGHPEAIYGNTKQQPTCDCSHYEDAGHAGFCLFRREQHQRVFQFDASIADVAQPCAGIFLQTPVH
jgi:hypothetical protein